jgi:hypothetical protein
LLEGLAFPLELFAEGFALFAAEFLGFAFVKVLFFLRLYGQNTYCACLHGLASEEGK